MSTKTQVSILLGYLLAAIITFGHAYRETSAPGNQFVTVSERKSSAALLCAMVWPLYWSVRAWEQQP